MQIPERARRIVAVGITAKPGDERIDRTHDDLQVVIRDVFKVTLVQIGVGDSGAGVAKRVNVVSSLDRSKVVPHVQRLLRCRS